MKPLGKQGESPLLSLRLPREMLEALRELAEKDRRKISDYLRLVIEDHIAARRKKGGR